MFNKITLDDVEFRDIYEILDRDISPAERSHPELPYTLTYKQRSAKTA